MRVQIHREIARGVMELGDDARMDIGDQASLELVENALLEQRTHFLPVDGQLAHVGDGDQRVESAHAFGRHRRVGDGRMVQVDRKVLWQHAMIVDVVEQAFVAWAEQDHVVRDARPAALDAEMHHEQGGAEALARQAARIIRAALGAGQQVLVAVHDVGIAGDGIEPFAPARMRFDLGRLLAQRVHMDHRVVQPHRAAKPFEMAHHARDQPVGSATRPPHAAIDFQLVDQRVDAAGLHRIAADQQRVEAQRLAQFLVLDIARDHRIDAAPGLLLGERRCRLKHRFEIEERHMAELDVAFLVNGFGIFEEPLVACNVGRIELGDLAEQLLFVVRIVELRPVGPGEPVERHDRHELDVFGDVVSRQCPQLLQAVGVRYHGRSGIEGETFALPVVGAATGLVARFDHRGLDAGGLEADGERQTTEARTDHAGTAPGRHRFYRPGGFVRSGESGSIGVHYDLSWTSGLPLPSKARIAAGTGTGGRPERMRSLSPNVGFPA